MEPTAPALLSNTAEDGCGSGWSDITSFAVTCVAVSGTGDATNQAGSGSCRETTVFGIGCLAISGLGAATNDTEWCGAHSPYVTTRGVYCVAVDPGLGD